jgi:hypothetical protein
MDAGGGGEGGNGKGSANVYWEDEEQKYAPNHGGQSSGGNPNDRHPFNPTRNGQLRYNPRHNSGRAYGGYAQGWQ